MKNKYITTNFIIRFILVIIMSIIMILSGDFSVMRVLLLIVSCLIFLYLFNMYRTLATPNQCFFKNRFLIEGMFLGLFCSFIPFLTNDIPVIPLSIITSMSIGLTLGLLLCGFLYKMDYKKKIKRITVDDSILKEEILTDWGVFLDPQGDIEGRVILTKDKFYFAPIFIATPIREYSLDDSANIVLLHKYGLPVGFSINNDSYKINYTRLWIKEISKITHRNFL